MRRDRRETFSRELRSSDRFHQVVVEGFDCDSTCLLHRVNVDANFNVVIPGRCKASNPESRDSGFASSMRPGMTGGREECTLPPTRSCLPARLPAALSPDLPGSA